MRHSLRPLWHALCLALLCTDASALTVTNDQFHHPRPLYVVENPTTTSWVIQLRGDFSLEEDWGDPWGAGNPLARVELSPGEGAQVEFRTPYSNPELDLSFDNEMDVLATYVFPMVSFVGEERTLEGLNYQATGLTATVYSREALTQEQSSQAYQMAFLFWRLASYYTPAEAFDKLPLANYSRRANALLLMDSLRVTPTMRLRFGQANPEELASNVNLLFGQNGLLIINLDDENRLSLAAGSVVKFNPGSGIFLYTEQPVDLSTGGDIKLFSWEAGAKVLGEENVTLTIPPVIDGEEEFVFGHTTIHDNALWATAHPWHAVGPFAALATELHRRALLNDASDAQHRVRQLFFSPIMWTTELQELSLKGVSLGTQYAMRQSLGFSLQDFMGAFGTDVVRFGLVGKNDTSPRKQRPTGVKLQDGVLVEDPATEGGFLSHFTEWIPTFDQPVQVSVIGSRTRNDGFTVDNVTSQMYPVSVERESTGFSLSLDRAAKQGLIRWGASLTYSNSDIRLSHPTESDHPWTGDSDMVSVKGYISKGLTFPNQWLVVSAGFSVANDMWATDYPENVRFTSDDITRTMGYLSAAYVASSTKLIPHVQVWGKAGSTLFWEKGIHYPVKANGEDFFNVKEPAKFLGRLEGGVGLASRLTTAGGRYAITFQTSLETHAYLGSRHRSITSYEGDAEASLRVKDAARYEGLYELGAILETPYGEVGVSAGAVYDTEGGRRQEVMGTVTLRF